MPMQTKSRDAAQAKPLGGIFHFIWAGLQNQGQTGGIVPSQRFLVERMISPVPADYSGQIIELGPGSGAITVPLARKCRRARILACEINPALAEATRQNVWNAGLRGRVKIVADSAENLLARIGREGGSGPDFIISGLPLANFKREKAVEIIEAIHGALNDGGMYIQFQHFLSNRRKVVKTFRKTRTVPALFNFPPAFVYYALK